MADALWDLAACQFGMETTPGTLVAADTLLPFTQGAYTPEIDRQELDEPRGALAVFDDLDVGKGSLLDLTTRLDFENVLLPLMTGLKNATPSAGPPYSYTFDPTLTAPQALAGASFENVLTDGSTDHYERAFGFGTCRQFGVNLAFGQPAELSAQYFGRAEQTVTKASPSALAREMIPSEKFTVDIDTTWAGLGTTQISTTIRSGQLTVITGAAPGRTLDGRADLDMTKLYRGRIMGTLALTMDFDADAGAEVDAWRDKDMRFIRLEATGASSRVLRFDTAGIYTAPPQIFSRDGNQMTVALTMGLRYDPTSAKQLEVLVTNQLSGF